ncbi:uncharacterized protein DC041_0011045 [Schistosoma bovis]|uniref:Nose resistant-to-fluoxetine protein N-terminal domain-containing protein n=1 Tax=Schistosoma bovis TaxID=6184 RepID=A0A430Q8V0_SCHBO|nr:uncharacterized protein DC041_0011045 [Schistosoma bovis]
MELCRNITDFSYGLSQHVQGKYCSAYVKLPSAEDLPEKVSFELNYGVCIPHSCTKDDLIWLLDMGLLIFNHDCIALSKVNLSIDKSTSFCHADFGELPKDGWFWVAMIRVSLPEDTFTTSEEENLVEQTPCDQSKSVKLSYFEYRSVLILYTGLFNHAYVGPMYPQTPNLMDIKFCRDHWWITYLNNFIYPDETCMGWSWYLSNEIQFSIVLSPIFLCLVAWNESIGVLFGFGLVISSIASTFGISYANDYLPGLLSTSSFTTIYIKPYTRWSTYAIGLLLGWFLEKYPTILENVNTKMKVLIGVIGVCLSSIFCVSTVYGLYGLLSGKVEPFTTFGAATYTAFHRPIFILGIAIVVSMCALGCGDLLEMSLEALRKLKLNLSSTPKN